MTASDCGHLRIDLSALADNYKAIDSITNGETAAVVKADAYGLGVEKIAPALHKAGCKTFFVAQLQEGINLRKLLPDTYIYVLNGIAEHDPTDFTKNNLIPCLISLEQIKKWQTSQAPAALMLDIGFNRLGLDNLAIAELANNQNLFNDWQLQLIVGHLACSNDSDHTMNRAQLEKFRDACAQLPPAPTSLANSGGVLLGSDYHSTLARTGIALYGGITHDQLNPVATLSAPLLQIRTITQGESVGYSAGFVASENMQIGIVALGYADGIPHQFGTLTPQPSLWVANQPAPICGRISMDTLAIDLSNHATPPKLGDMVEVFGANNPLPHLAATGHTTPYELLTRLGNRLKRVYV